MAIELWVPLSPDGCLVPIEAELRHTDEHGQVYAIRPQGTLEWRINMSRAGMLKFYRPQPSPATREEDEDERTA